MSAPASAGVRQLLPYTRFNTIKSFQDLRVVADLPKPYQKFYREWMASTDKEAPVHWIPRKEKWIRNPETGEVKVFQNEPIPVVYPPEMHQGIWGGEGVVEGLIKKAKYRSPVPKFWVPRLLKTVVYSEILDKHLSAVVTERALVLIDQHFGLDAYLIKTPAYDLKTLLSMKLKRKLLLALLDRDFCHHDLKKQEELFKKYESYLIPREELEWYGYSVDEALEKYNKQQAWENRPYPLKEKLREAYIKQKQEESNKPSESSTSEKISWTAKLNPFSKPAEVP